MPHIDKALLNFGRRFTSLIGEHSRPFSPDTTIAVPALSKGGEVRRAPPSRRPRAQIVRVEFGLSRSLAHYWLGWLFGFGVTET
jgi:hypothetical protein